jgi:hypothetical protein
MCPQNRGKTQTHLKNLANTATKLTPNPSQQQLAWDILTKFEVTWQSLERVQAQRIVAEHQKAQSGTLLIAFEKAREIVLGGLYKDIGDEFMALYRTLHEHESSTFTASIRPDKAGLKIEVDFYGRGKFPPIAMHSEGHQDSMGLCLYLALLGKLTSDKVGLTILDDVVMSVDSGHRRPVCELLLRKFPERQFFITTHDKMWARQLRNVGVVPSNNYLTFREWTVETGPRWQEEDKWEEIEQLIKQENVPQAAASLRRELEEFFDDVADALAARVPYSGEGKYDLGDLAPGGLSQLAVLLAEAKKAAQSWGQTQSFDEIRAFDDVFKKAKQESQAEKWAINESIHFNRWIQATPTDFKPVLNSFLKLRDCYKCSACETILYIYPRKSPEGLRCRCGKINWNLREKPKET